MKREARSKWLKELRSHQASGFGGLGKAQRKEKELKEMENFCEDYTVDISRLLMPGEVWDEASLKARDAKTFSEEKESILAFARALKISIKGMTLRELIKSVWLAWQEQGHPLLNPYTQKFSDSWEFRGEPIDRIFEEIWQYTEGDYDLPLLTPASAPSE
jgi:hypothetical protein